MTQDKLLEMIDETIAWASNISELWTGTLHADIIDSQQAQLIKAVDQQDYKKAYNLMCDLAQTLDYAEKVYEVT